MKLWKKWVLGTLAFLGILLIITLLLAPGIIHRYIEKNDIDLIGREITMDDLSIGWLTAKIEITGFDIKEQDPSISFVSYDRLFLDIHLWSLFQGFIHVKEIALENPKVRLVQNGTEFNFSDLLALGASEKPDSSATESSSWNVAIENYHLDNGTILYQSNLQPDFEILGMNVLVPLLSDTSSQIHSLIDFNLLTGGTFELETDIFPSLDLFNTEVNMANMDFTFLEPYFKAYLDVQEVSGDIDLNLSARGALSGGNDLRLKGEISLSEFLMIDIFGDEIVSLENLHIGLDSIDLANAEFDLGDLVITGFEGKYEVFEDTDTYTRIIKPALNEEGPDTLKTGEAVNFENPFSIAAAYAEHMVKSYKSADYKLNHFEIANCAFTYNDYTMREAFRYEISEIHVGAEGINSHDEYLLLKADATVNELGRFEGSIKSYTDNLRNIDIDYKLYGTQLSPFSPYSDTYVAHPIVQGDLIYENSTRIRDKHLESSNNIVLDDFTFGQKTDYDGLYNLPVRLAVGLLKDKNGDIVLDLPIEGDLDDPEYKYSKAIWTAVKNVIVNIVTAPFKFIGNQFGIEEEKLEQLNFGLLQMKLSKQHEKQLDEMSRVLEGRPDLNIEFKRATRQFETMESFAILETAHLYLFGTTVEDVLPKDESEAISNLDLNDSAFVHFVNKKIPTDKLHLPIQSKCLEYVGNERARLQSDKVGARRIASVRAYLQEKRDIDSTRIRFFALPTDSLITSRSASIYKVGFWVEENETYGAK